MMVKGNKGKFVTCLMLLAVASASSVKAQEDDAVELMERITAIATHYDQVTPLVMGAVELMAELYTYEKLLHSDPAIAGQSAKEIIDDLQTLTSEIHTISPPPEAEDTFNKLLLWFENLEEVIDLFLVTASPDYSTPVENRLSAYRESKACEAKLFTEAKDAYIQLLGDYGIPLER